MTPRHFCYRCAVRIAELGVILLALSGCRPVDEEPSRPPGDSAAPLSDSETDAGGEVDDGAAVASDDECVSLVDAAIAEEAYARGVAKLREAKDGEHYLAEPFTEGLGALRTAAEQGHRAAQSLYGRRAFESMFMAEAPSEAQRDDYVSALSFVRIAAIRGDSDAADYMPGIGAEIEASEPPFDSFPPEWIEQVVAEADTWLRCYGESAGDRGAQ